jgi:hypothetical protein
MTALPTTETPPPQMTPRERLLWEGIRQALLIFLSSVERYLGVERTHETRRERAAREYAGIDRHIDA